MNELFIPASWWVENDASLSRTCPSHVCTNYPKRQWTLHVQQTWYHSLTESRQPSTNALEFALWSLFHLDVEGAHHNERYQSATVDHGKGISGYTFCPANRRVRRHVLQIAQILFVSFRILQFSTELFSHYLRLYMSVFYMKRHKIWVSFNQVVT